MRIITGSLKGRTIPFKAHGDVRLTSGMLKEALFAMIGDDLDGRSFLDLCAGCGQIGLEAYSRGARVVLNEPDKHRFAQLKELLQAWRLPDVALHRMKAQVFISWQQEQGGHFDFIYLDPPYHLLLHGMPLSIALLQQLGASTLLGEGDILFVQHQDDLALPATAGHLALFRQRDYSQTTLSVYTSGQAVDGARQ